MGDDVAPKRAACDRCHRLKMRCESMLEEDTNASSSCNRCRGAGVVCNFSAVRKSGRPPTKATGAIIAGLSASQQKDPIAPSRPLPMPGPSRGNSEVSTGYNYFLETDLSSVLSTTSHSATEAPSTSLVFSDSDHPFSIFMSPDMDWDQILSIEEDAPSQESDNAPSQSSFPVPTAHFGSGSNLPTATDSSRHYMEQLSLFNMYLMCTTELAPPGNISSSQLEKIASHTLSSSLTFLDLVKSHQYLTSGGGSPRTKLFAPVTAIVLQLVLFGMRLRELHYCLYSCVYRYLQHQQHSDIAAQSFPPFLNVCVSGINLTLHPQFQLQLLLQTSVHYLGMIQDALEGIVLQLDVPEPLQVADQCDMSPAMLIRILIGNDQRRQKEYIREVLTTLREEYNMVIPTDGITDT